MAGLNTLMLADGQRTRASWAAAWRWMLDQAGLSETFANSDPPQGSPLLNIATWICNPVTR